MKDNTQGVIFFCVDKKMSKNYNFDILKRKKEKR